MKKLQELHDAETQEMSKHKKDLEIENEDLKIKLAKLDMNLTQLHCENKVSSRAFNKINPTKGKESRSEHRNQSAVFAFYMSTW